MMLETFGYVRPTPRANHHGDLQHDLARHLRAAEWLTYTEIQIPHVNGRIDVAAVKPHAYARADLRAYEVKATRSDLISGLNSDKWKEYRTAFHRVYFAFPAGLAKLEEIPAECGVVVRGRNGWSHLRSARGHTPDRLDYLVVLALLYRGVEEERTARDLAARLNWEKDGRLRAETARTFGREIARRLQGERHELEAPLVELRSLLEDALGVPLDTPGRITDAAERLHTFVRIFQDFRRHSVLLSKVGEYCATIGRAWSDERLESVTAYTEKELANADLSAHA